MTYFSEVVEVAEDSADVKKWPLWRDSTCGDAPLSLSSTDHSSSPAAAATMLVATPSDSLVSPPNSEAFVPAVAVERTTIGALNQPNRSTPKVTDTSSAAGKPNIRRPGPRKPKTTLAALPGSSKPKKLTTLDKSAMDWRSHVQAEQESGSSIKDELEANRRAGGYLEKVEFLKRVEERKEETLDSLKSNKRRKL